MCVYFCVWNMERKRGGTGEKEKARELSRWNHTSFLFLLLFKRGYDVTRLQKHCHRNNSDCANWCSHLRHGNNNPKKNSPNIIHCMAVIVSIWLISLNSFDSTYIYVSNLFKWRCVCAGACTTLSQVLFASIFRLTAAAAAAAATCSYFINHALNDFHSTKQQKNTAMLIIIIRIVFIWKMLFFFVEQIVKHTWKKKLTNLIQIFLIGL